MAFNQPINILGINSLNKIRAGDAIWCFGQIVFAIADSYVANGPDIRQTIRRRFGVTEVLAVIMNGFSSDAGLGGNGAAAIGRYDSQNGTLKLYGIGRKTNSTAGPQSETEITGTSINNLAIQFLAICRGEGRSDDQKANG
jgi:hypothetical protein